MPLLPPPPPYSADYCDDQYNNGLRVPDVRGLLARWQTDAARARNELVMQAGIAYGEDASETFDLFESVPRDASPRPLLIFIHGGYWRSLAKSDFSWIARPYVARGIEVAVVDYGLAPLYPLERIVRQQLRAIAFLWLNAERFGIDRRRIVVSGHSAGGHLTAMMLAARWDEYDPRLPRRLLAGGVAVSGLFDLEPIRHAPYLNGDLQLTEERVAPLSPLYMTPASDAPLITAVGAEESDEFRRQTHELGLAWADVLRENIMVPGGDHFSACESFATPGTRLFEATAALCTGAVARE